MFRTKKTSLHAEICVMLFLDEQDELQISGDDIDFSGIDEDLEQFQQDDIVRQALLQGVDLRGYARDIDLELREVIGMDELFICAFLLLNIAIPTSKSLGRSQIGTGFALHHPYKCDGLHSSVPLTSCRGRTATSHSIF